MSTDHSETPAIGVIGVGQVGTALAVALAERGYRITSVFSRTPNSAIQLARRTASRPVGSIVEVIASADLTLLTVSDDAIESVANALAHELSARAFSIPSLRPKAVVHTSGAHDRHALDALSELGWMTGSLHPALPLAKNSLDRPGKPFEGAAFALEGDHTVLLAWLEGIVSALYGSSFRLIEGQKALYHAALVMASNYTVSLYAFAEQLLLLTGLSQAAAKSTLNALMQATLHNLKQQAASDALTGPLVRADLGTISQHLRALHEQTPQGIAAYRALARLTFPLLQARGIAIDRIEQLLQQDESS